MSSTFSSLFSGSAEKAAKMAEAVNGQVSEAINTQKTELEAFFSEEKEKLINAVKAKIDEEVNAAKESIKVIIDEELEKLKGQVSTESDTLVENIEKVASFNNAMASISAEVEKLNGNNTGTSKKTVESTNNQVHTGGSYGGLIRRHN